MPVSFVKYRYLAAFSLISLFALTGFGCAAPSVTQKKLEKPLVVWGLWQDSTMMDPVVRAFKEKTGYEVEYKKIASVASYEKMLLEALAQGRGPDVFVIHHTWVEGKRGIMAAAPSDVIDSRALTTEFVDVVAHDLSRDGKIYALPTSVDTLALFYNKDLFNAAGVARPAATWLDLQRDVEKITRVNRIGTIEQSAIALGTGSNINRAGDLIQVLMLQSGLNIYNNEDKSIDIVNEAGERALEFYTGFANKAKRVFSWDLTQDYSIDAFSEGQTAMMVNYSYQIPVIQAKNPRLNFGIAPLPQNADSTAINFSAYWPFAVANTSAASHEAWEFIRFMTSAEMSTEINKAQQAPPARRDNVVQLSRDPVLGVFAEQALSAKTWARADISATDTIFSEMADSVVTGSATIQEAVQRAHDRLKLLYASDENQ